MFDCDVFSFFLGGFVEYVGETGVFVNKIFRTIVPVNSHDSFICICSSETRAGLEYGVFHCEGEADGENKRMGRAVSGLSI